MLQFSAASLAFSSAFCSPSVVGTTLWPCSMTTPPLCPLSLWWCLRLSVWLGCMEQTGEAFFFFSWRFLTLLDLEFHVNTNSCHMKTNHSLSPLDSLMTSRWCSAGVPVWSTSTCGSISAYWPCWGCWERPPSECLLNIPLIWHGTKRRYGGIDSLHCLMLKLYTCFFMV